MEITEIKGIGPKHARSLKKLNITSVEDLLAYPPIRYDRYRYLDTTYPSKSAVWVMGIIAQVPQIHWYAPKKCRVRVVIEQEQQRISLIFFNQAFLAQKLQPGMLFYGKGTWDLKHKTVQIQDFELLEEEHLAQIEKTDRLVPVYRLTEGISQYQMRQWKQYAWQHYRLLIEESLPVALVEKYQLVSKSAAYEALVAPQLESDVIQAFRRLIFEEFFLFHNEHLRRKEQAKIYDVIYQWSYSGDALRSWIKTLPFELTDAQKRVSNQICFALKQPYPLKALLQGDVGSGKTIISALASVVALLSEKQVAILAPTEILAEQHYKNFKQWFAALPYEVFLLTSRTSKKERTALLARLKEDTPCCVIGTHALLQEDVQFFDLGLVVVDEEHRFGVNQRKMLHDKGTTQWLHMTATPIPRTLAAAVSMWDVFVLDERPKGRAVIQTQWLSQEQWPDIFAWAESFLLAGDQMYCVCPAIDEAVSEDLITVDILSQWLSVHYPKLSHRILHGQMPAEEKEQLMSQFLAGDFSVLIATTVIEVGVDVPNASMMVVMNAERFGLAQLHQLRGRVGRGNKASTCFLVSSPKTEQGKERMQLMTEIDNGFVLSEYDLKQRGPGDVLGTKQSGLPEFLYGSLQEHYEIFQKAYQEAVMLMEDKGL